MDVAEPVNRLDSASDRFANRKRITYLSNTPFRSQVRITPCSIVLVVFGGPNGEDTRHVVGEVGRNLLSGFVDSTLMPFGYATSHPIDLNIAERVGLKENAG
jgi:hypothetical protein